MPDSVPTRTRALVGWSFVVTFVLAPVGAAAATTADCGGGEIEILQDDRDPTTVVGARVSVTGPACDGQPVGVQFLGNDSGEPALPAEELAHAYSDEDPCTGAEHPTGVLRDGTVDVLLCEGSTTSGHVDGEQLTRMRLITTAGVTTTGPGPTDDPPPAGPGDVDPAPEPPAEGALPVTGADALRAVLVGAALVLAGSGLLRLGRVRLP